MATSRCPDQPQGSEPERERAAGPTRVPLARPQAPAPPVPLVGDGMPVPCMDGTERPYLSFDAAASTGALSQVPWSRAATCRYVECGPDGTFSLGAVEAALEERPAPRLLADQVKRGDRGAMPGAVRASAGVNTTEDDVQRLLAAVARVADGRPPVQYSQDPHTGDYHPDTGAPSRLPRPRPERRSCSPG